MKNCRGTALTELVIIVPLLLIILFALLITHTLLVGKGESVWEAFQVNLIAGRRGGNEGRMLSPELQKMSEKILVHVTHSGRNYFGTDIPLLPAWDRELSIQLHGKDELNRLPFYREKILFTEKSRAAIDPWAETTSRGKKIKEGILLPLYTIILSTLWR